MALDMVTSPVPVIEISFAPPEEPQPEPYSPFTPLNQGFHGTGGGGGSSNDDDEDGYRSTLLTPPAHSYSLSPLRSLPSSSSKKVKGQGLKDEAFQALLRASKERSRAVLCSSASASAQKKKDLRKEVAIKAHKNKQAERRALFLSKIGAPPSPTAISLPKTPPESPAIFHYSLPSPGLVSPLEHFERLELGGCAGGQGLGYSEEDEEEKVEGGGGGGGMYYVTRKRWVEQVDFRTLGCTTTTCVRKQQQQQQQKVLAGNSLEEKKEPGPRPGLMLLPTITVTTGESEETQDVQGGVEGPSEVQRRRVQEQQQKRNGHGHARKTSWPSLEQIMERYSGASTTIVSTASTAAATATSNATDATSSEDKNEAVRVRAPLPAFIVAQQQQRVQQVKQVEKQPEQQQQQRQARPRLTCTGRIRFPSREITTTTTTSSSTTTSTASANTASAAMTTADDGNGNVGVVPRQRQRTDSLLPSSSPSLPVPVVSTVPAVHMGAGPVSDEDKCSTTRSSPTFEITITQVPDVHNQNQNQNRSRHQLTEANLEVFNSRTRTAKDMLCALRRRTAAAVGVGGAGAGVGGRWDGVNANANGMGSRVKTGAGYGYNHNYNYNLNYTYNRNLNSNLGGCMNGIGGGGGCIGIGMGGGMSKLGYGPGSLLSPRAPWTGDNNGNVNDGDEYGDEDVEKHRRRNSAPAELPTVNRFGFMHPVLALPAGF